MKVARSILAFAISRKAIAGILTVLTVVIGVSASNENLDACSTVISDVLGGLL